MNSPIKSTIMVFVQDIITGDKMGHYNHLSSIEREIILCGIPKRHLRHKGKPRRRKGNEEKRGKIPITNNITDRPKEANERTRIVDWKAVLLSSFTSSMAKRNK